jgi:hypothetical protein
MLPIGLNTMLCEKIDDFVGEIPAKFEEATHLGGSGIGHKEGTRAGIERRPGEAEELVAPDI